MLLFPSPPFLDSGTACVLDLMFSSYIARPHSVTFTFYTSVINGSLLHTAHLYCEDGGFTRQVGPSWQLNREKFTPSQTHLRSSAREIDVPAEAHQSTRRAPWTYAHDSICYLTDAPGDRSPCSKMVPVNEIRLDLRTDTDSNSAIKRPPQSYIHQDPSVHSSASRYTSPIAMCASFMRWHCGSNRGQLSRWNYSSCRCVIEPRIHGSSFPCWDAGEGKRNWIPR